MTNKIHLLASVAVIFFSGLTYTVYAADGHGHGHGHEDNEESHDKANEEHGHGHEDAGHDDGHGEEGAIHLTPEQIDAAGIRMMRAAPGQIDREINVPGKIIPAEDRQARIVPKVGGTVYEVRKNLGDIVEKGEVLALIESREMAEAVAEQQAAARGVELARATFSREKDLWQRKITAEQDYLSARNAHQEASIRLDLANQKLKALGQDASASVSRFHELKSPIKGRIIVRALTLGEYVDTTHTAFSVADLGTVWVDTAIPPADLSSVREGQSALVTGGGGKAQGRLIFISPVIDPETRSAKAIIELDNPDGAWRAGDYANAAIATATQKSGISIPKEALQTIAGKPAVFVRTAEGFEKRDVTPGKESAQSVEITAGLTAGESVAVSNTFTLKAELGKSEAEHTH